MINARDTNRNRVKTPALFLDRDGVINEEKEYVYRREDFKFLTGVFDACRQAHALGYKLIVVTNQSGIARGLYSEEDFHTLTEWMLHRFSREHILIDGVYFCPHHPTEGTGKYRKTCRCRKPLPGLIEQAADEHDIDLASSALVGDKIRDIEAGINAGVGKNILVNPGRQTDSNSGISTVSVVPNLAGAVKCLEEKHRK